MEALLKPNVAAEARASSAPNMDVYAGFVTAWLNKYPTQT
jgi:hypothetical protein